MLESLFHKVAGLKASKETPTQVFSWKIREIFKTTYFEKQLRATASIRSLRLNLNYSYKKKTKEGVILINKGFNQDA